MSNLVLFPGPFLFSCEVPRHEEIKNAVLEYIEQELPNLSPIDDAREKQSGCTFYEGRSKFQNFIHTTGFVNDIVWEPLDKCLNDLPFHIHRRPTHSTLSEIWFNCYDKGGHHSEHTHSGCTFSGIYIVQCDETNKTVFFGRGEGNQPYQHFYYTTDDVKEGTVLLFPAEMIHRVLETEGRRVVIPFNITSR